MKLMKDLSPGTNRQEGNTPSRRPDGALAPDGDWRARRECLNSLLQALGHLQQTILVLQEHILDLYVQAAPATILTNDLP